MAERPGDDQSSGAYICRAHGLNSAWGDDRGARRGAPGDERAAKHRPVDITPIPDRRRPPRSASRARRRRLRDRAHSAGPDPLDQRRHDHPGIAGRPEPLLRNAISVQNILSTTTMIVSTNPKSPLFGGGTSNIAFLLGNAAGAPRTPTPSRWRRSSGSRPSSTSFTSTFPNGSAPTTIQPRGAPFGLPVPTFLLDPPVQLTGPQHHQGDLDPNPIQPEGDSELQRPVLAACLGRDTGADGSAADPGLGLAMIGRQISRGPAPAGSIACEYPRYLERRICSSARASLSSSVTSSAPRAWASQR